MYIPCICWSG